MGSRTYRVMSAVSTFLARQGVTVDIRNQHMGINCKLGLKGGLLAIAEKNRWNVH